MKSFSVVIATYTGIETIGDTLDSILNQHPIEAEYEVIVVIDGLNVALRKVVTDKSKEFTARSTTIKVIQFRINRGRFEARIAGAKKASFNHLLLLDDRVHLHKNYFKMLQTMKEKIAMANIVEVAVEKTSIISQTLFLIRRSLFKDKFGTEFKDYYINDGNFESSPKGTGGLWISKSIFLNACDKAININDKSNKHVNEDTKILRAVVNSGHNIYRSSKLTAYYKPRSDIRTSIKHLYDRGPRFVDYYSKPGTRFFPILLITYLLPAAIIIGWVLGRNLAYLILLSAAVMLVVSALVISKNVKEFSASLGGLVLIAIIFGLGIYKGTAIKLFSRFHNK